MFMSNEQTNYLGRCKQKGCDYALFATSEQVTHVENFSGVKAGQAPVRVGNNGVFGRCKDSHKFFPLKAVSGTYSDKHKCDSRCLNAKGNDCTCSCGGMNHGRGYAVEIMAAPARPQSNEDQASEKQETFIRSLLESRIIPDSDKLTGYDRKVNAVIMLKNHEFTKRQASKTIEWLLTLPKEEV
jgi:hypothetical protein